MGACAWIPVWLLPATWKEFLQSKLSTSFLQFSKAMCSATVFLYFSALDALLLGNQVHLPVSHELWREFRWLLSFLCISTIFSTSFLASNFSSQFLPNSWQSILSSLTHFLVSEFQISEKLNFATSQHATTFFHSWSSFYTWFSPQKLNESKKQIWILTAYARTTHLKFLVYCLNLDSRPHFIGFVGNLLNV